VTSSWSFIRQGFGVSRDICEQTVYVVYIPVFLLNQLLLLWWCATCTPIRLPQGPVQCFDFFHKAFFRLQPKNISVMIVYLLTVST